MWGSDFLRLASIHEAIVVYVENKGSTLDHVAEVTDGPPWPQELAF